MWLASSCPSLRYLSEAERYPIIVFEACKLSLSTTTYYISLDYITLQSCWLHHTSTLLTTSHYIPVDDITCVINSDHIITHLVHQMWYVLYSVHVVYIMYTIGCFLGACFIEPSLHSQYSKLLSNIAVIGSKLDL